MKLLITVASKHGSTAEIASALRRELVDDGFECDLVPPLDATDPKQYDAVIIGSAVYAGRWMASARKYAQKHAKALVDMPVWLFSSGPVGDPPKPGEDDVVELGTLISAVQPIEHRVFAGKIDADSLNLIEKTVLRAVKAPPDGDYRDFDEVAAWGRTITRYLNKRDTERHRR
jgi:menaquinone-dependent protoporphyrinogen oxidase